MQRTDIATGLTSDFQNVKFTIGFADLTTAATTQTISLPTNPTPVGAVQTAATTAPPNAANFVIPQAGYINYVKIHHTTAFAGGALTSMTVSVGKLGGSATFCTPAFNVFQAVADTTLQETFAIPSGQVTQWGITVTFTSIGANVSAATAGSVDIYIGYTNVSSPSE